ncbi:MAG: hypothetical protein V3S30_03665 [Thermoanaerobaculia bacterium]
MWFSRALAYSLILVILPPHEIGAQASTTETYIEQGDAAWNDRATGHSGSRAASGPIGEAVHFYELAVGTDPKHLEARWKLLRALYFQGEFAVPKHDAKLEIFMRGKELAEESIDILAAPVGGRDLFKQSTSIEIARLLAGQPDAASIYHWAAAHWGLVGRVGGIFAAVRQGVAQRVRDYALITTALDERIENAGGHRILGRLHTEAPRIPFITGWVDHQLAITELERAVELVPDDLLSRLYLVEALMKFSKHRRGEALSMLDDLLTDSPDPRWIVECARVLEDALVLRDRFDG